MGGGRGFCQSFTVKRKAEIWLRTYIIVFSWKMKYNKIT